jgi:hypothetical protein
MAERSNIPMRPSGAASYKLTNAEKDCLTWYVLSGCKKEDAFKTFVHPDMVLSLSTLKEATKQFFAMKDVNDYIEAYTATLTNKQKEAPKEEMSDELREKKKINALKRLVDYVINEAENINDLDDPTMLLKIADKVGFFDDGTSKNEAPRRYLPARCYSECLYRKFCEDAVSNKEAINECDYCKARKFAEERGFEYNPANLLNLP